MLAIILNRTHKMEIGRRKMKVHKSLYELFGRETTSLDLLLILFGSITLTIAAQILCLGIELPLTKKVLLAFLTLDIGGGIIANFTDGTNNYYAESVKRRYLFIAIHILQPLILSWIFPNDFYSIFSLAIYALASSFIISIKKTGNQKTLAATMLLIGVVLMFLFNFSSQALQLILLIYSVKLILAFSVNWTN